MTPQSEIPAPQTPRVTVVIVSLNRVAGLKRSLEALGNAHQIVVVDNGSTDGAAELDEEFPHVIFSRLPRNFGLTKAMNIGVRAADGEYVLFLHDDAFISGESVSRLADYLEAHPEAGAVAPLLTDESGNPAPQVCPLPTPSTPGNIFQPVAGAGDEIVAECVSGAAFMFRSFLLRALRQIDERYGQYGNEIELCAQVRRSSKKIVILRGVTAIHLSAESPVAADALAGDRVVGTAVFLAKHHGFVSSFLYRLTTALTAMLTFRFRTFAGAVAGQKIDGNG